MNDGKSRIARVKGRPWVFDIDPARTALLVIDMQHEFLSRGGWIDALGLEIERLRPIVPVVTRLIDACRTAGVSVVYTREGYRADLADVPPLKLARGRPPIGAPGERGRYLVVGEPGHAIIPEVAPLPDEIVIDKPGAGSFYATLLDQILRLKGITHLMICGATADVCVNATLYEANDRGYECILIPDATGAYDDYSTTAVATIAAQGVVGGIAESGRVLNALSQLAGVSE